MILISSDLLCISKPSSQLCVHPKHVFNAVIDPYSATAPTVSIAVLAVAVDRKSWEAGMGSVMLRPSRIIVW